MQRTELKTRKMLTSDNKSKFQKYQELIIGQPGWWNLIRYELIMLFCSAIPGALGLFLRSKLYPSVLGHVGKNVIFGSNVVLRHPHKIRIGDNVVIDDNCLIDAKGVDNQGITIGNNCFLGRNSILSCKDGDIIIEDGVTIGFNCEVFASSKVTIGENTMLAAYCYLIGGGAYDLTNLDVSFADQSEEALDSVGGIDVGKNVWLAADVKVIDGVTIGHDAVIGAGAVVRNYIPAYSIAAGVPAKILRSRKPEPATEAETKPNATTSPAGEADTKILKDSEPSAV
jgi:acetyltransferase-like isoleucine patch superfamily enzyme